MWNLKYDTDELLYKRNRLPDIENKLNLEKNVHMYNWMTLMYTWNIVNQLYFKLKKKKEKHAKKELILKNKIKKASLQKYTVNGRLLF